MGFEDGLFFANDEVWKRQRRMVMAAFDPRHVKAYFPSLVTVATRLETRWRKAATVRTEIDLQGDLMRYTVDAIAGLAFGADVNTLEAEDAIQKHLNLIFPAIARRVTSAIPYWRYFKLPADRKLERSVGQVKAAIELFIKEARDRLAQDPARREEPKNLLEAMIVAAEQEGDESRNRDIAGNVFMMLVAGEDTTANTLAWMLELLYRNPEALQRAEAEVRHAFPPGVDMTMEALGGLDYIEACIHETMRLKPVAAFLPSQAIKDTVVDGIEVPADTLVIGLIRPDATAEQYFPEPKRFDPDRWLGTAGGKSTTRVSMPFGAGSRLCPGRYLALLEMKLAMAMLLRTFKIERVGTQSGQPARELFAFAMGPVGLRMRLTERTEASKPSGR
jgi:cytochrome P450